jgi:transmembrane sensor
MDSLPTYDNLPWDMIVSALQGTLSPGEELEFRKWLAISADNQLQYDQLQRIWKDRLANYMVYREADEVKALEALHARINNKRVIVTYFAKGTPTMRRWMAAAAVLLLAIGSSWWYLSRQRGSVGYETASNERKSISLPDGSTVELNPQTHIQVVPGYNKAGRTVILVSGEAHFDVSHQERIPFVVDMDVASVKDIGTNFTVQRTKDSIHVTVSGGRVAFVQKKTGEVRELSAGNSLTFYIRENRFGNMEAANAVSSETQSLVFSNSPLSEVIAVLQKVSGKKISLSDTALGQKRLTVDLNGIAFDNALKIICASLNLEYAEKNSGYILKKSDRLPHNY